MNSISSIISTLSLLFSFGAMIDVEKRLLIKHVSVVKTPKRLAVGYFQATGEQPGARP
jgi:hypothetical protein